MLVLGVGGVQRSRCRAERRDREQQLDDLGPVRKDERDTVATDDADGREAAGKCRDALRQLGVGQCVAVVRREQRRERPVCLR